MDLTFTAEEEAFRAEVKAFLDAELPTSMRQTYHGFGRHDFDQSMEWHRILARKGWVAPGWPRSHGGCEWTPVQQYIFEEEAMRAGAPRLRPFGLKMLAPVLLKFGSPALQERFLPPILSGEEFWCQGFSEPGSGSDLASLRTRAVREGDHYVVNGQKTWNTYGHKANWMFALVRTDPDADRPQKGISMLLIPMDAEGVTVRPIRTIDGFHHINEVFFEDVRVPAELLVGEENKGWTYAKFLLGNERVGIANVGQSKAELALLREIAMTPRADGTRAIDDDMIAVRLADIIADFAGFEITNLRMLTALKPGRDVGAISSYLKLRGTDIQNRISALAMDISGPLGMSWDHDAEAPQETWGSHGWAITRPITIYGGASEILKNIVAKQVLEL